MTMQFSTAVRNARGDVTETTIGVSPVLKIRTTTVPANCAAVDSGTVLATLNLPSDWLTAAASGVKNQSGTWEDVTADATGTAGHFRVYDSGGTCHIQGTVTATGGGGDMTIDNVSIAINQDVIVTGFTITEGNA